MQSNYLVCFTLVCSTSKWPFHGHELESVLGTFNIVQLNCLNFVYVCMFLKLILFKLLKWYNFVLVKVVFFWTITIINLIVFIIIWFSKATLPEGLLRPWCYWSINLGGSTSSSQAVSLRCWVRVPLSSPSGRLGRLYEAPLCLLS